MDTVGDLLLEFHGASDGGTTRKELVAAMMRTWRLPEPWARRLVEEAEREGFAQAGPGGALWPGPGLWAEVLGQRLNRLRDQGRLGELAGIVASFHRVGFRALPVEQELLDRASAPGYAAPGSPAGASSPSANRAAEAAIASGQTAGEIARTLACFPVDRAYRAFAGALRRRPDRWTELGDLHLEFFHAWTSACAEPVTVGTAGLKNAAFFGHEGLAEAAWAHLEGAKATRPLHRVYMATAQAEAGRDGHQQIARALGEGLDTGDEEVQRGLVFLARAMGHRRSFAALDHLCRLVGVWDRWLPAWDLRRAFIEGLQQRQHASPTTAEWYDQLVRLQGSPVAPFTIATLAAASDGVDLVTAVDWILGFTRPAVIPVERLDEAARALVARGVPTLAGRLLEHPGYATGHGPPREVLAAIRQGLSTDEDRALLATLFGRGVLTAAWFEEELQRLSAAGTTREGVDLVSALPIGVDSPRIQAETARLADACALTGDLVTAVLLRQRQERRGEEPAARLWAIADSRGQAPAVLLEAARAAGMDFADICGEPDPEQTAMLGRICDRLTTTSTQADGRPEDPWTDFFDVSGEAGDVRCQPELPLTVEQSLATVERVLDDRTVELLLPDGARPVCHHDEVYPALLVGAPVLAFKVGERWSVVDPRWYLVLADLDTLAEALRRAGAVALEPLIDAAVAAGEDPARVLARSHPDLVAELVQAGELVAVSHDGQVPFVPGGEQAGPEDVLEGTVCGVAAVVERQHLPLPYCTRGHPLALTAQDLAQARLVDPATPLRLVISAEPLGSLQVQRDRRWVDRDARLPGPYLLGLRDLAAAHPGPLPALVSHIDDESSPRRMFVLLYGVRLALFDELSDFDRERPLSDQLKLGQVIHVGVRVELATGTVILSHRAPDHPSWREFLLAHPLGSRVDGQKVFRSARGYVVQLRDRRGQGLLPFADATVGPCPWHMVLRDVDLLGLEVVGAESEGFLLLKRPDTCPWASEDLPAEGSAIVCWAVGAREGRTFLQWRPGHVAPVAGNHELAPTAAWVQIDRLDPPLRVARRVWARVDRVDRTTRTVMLTPLREPAQAEVRSEGRVVAVHADAIHVDVGFERLGAGARSTWPRAAPGDTIHVLVGRPDGEGHLPIHRVGETAWRAFVAAHKTGDVVRGVVTRASEPGLILELAPDVNGFVYRNQIDLEDVDPGAWAGRELEGEITKLDLATRTANVSRRQLLSRQMRAERFARLSVGDVVEGVVKTIADFGGFIDLGGLNALCHLTELSWNRVSHPSEVLHAGAIVKVKVTRLDPTSGRVWVSVKHLTTSPWDAIKERYPAGSRASGMVVSLPAHGALVELEEGVTGLVRASELSWSRRVRSPSELVRLGERIDVVVIRVDVENREIALSLRQTGTDPWSLVASKYAPGEVVTGLVRDLTNYAAFVELEEGIEGFLHVSDLSWTRKINHPSQMLAKGDQVRAIVLSLDHQRRRLALSLKHLVEDPWAQIIPSRYPVGASLEGLVTKLTNFGAFVELEGDLVGLLHTSELADQPVESPSVVVAPGDRIHVKVIRVDAEKRQIGLSLRQALAVGAPGPRPNQSEEGVVVQAARPGLALAPAGEVGLPPAPTLERALDPGVVAEVASPRPAPNLGRWRGGSGDETTALVEALVGAGHLASAALVAGIALGGGQPAAPPPPPNVPRWVALGALAGSGRDGAAAIEAALRAVLSCPDEALAYDALAALLAPELILRRHAELMAWLSSNRVPGTPMLPVGGSILLIRAHERTKNPEAAWEATNRALSDHPDPGLVIWRRELAARAKEALRQRVTFQFGERTLRWDVSQGLRDGAFAYVFPVLDVADRYGDVLALKHVLPRAVSTAEMEDVLDMFDREADILSRCHHEAVVAFREYPARGCLLLEWFPGGPIEPSRPAPGRWWTLQRALELGVAVAGAMLHVRAVVPGFVHNDIMPANILHDPSRYPAPGWVKLIDFGLAHAGHRHLSALLDDVGFIREHGYRAPEVRAGRDGGEAGDVYSLGAILFALVTGDVPQADSDLEPLGPARDVVEWMLEPSADRRPTWAEAEEHLRRTVEGLA